MVLYRVCVACVVCDEWVVVCFLFFYHQKTHLIPPFMCVLTPTHPLLHPSIHTNRNVSASSRPCTLALSCFPGSFSMPSPRLSRASCPIPPRGFLLRGSGEGCYGIVWGRLWRLFRLWACLRFRRLRIARIRCCVSFILPRVPVLLMWGGRQVGMERGREGGNEGEQKRGTSEKEWNTNKGMTFQKTDNILPSVPPSSSASGSFSNDS